MEMKSEQIRVLDHGHVQLEDCMANDLKVVNSARVSVDVRHEVMEMGDDELIGFLMRKKHGTPFEHNAFTFIIKAPIFVFREWQRHRIASYNELSARYKEFTNPDFYIPAKEDVRTQVGKPGAYTFEQWQGPVSYETVRALTIRHYQDCYEMYKYKISIGWAKELARCDLPFALYSQMYWTTNARSMMNFIELRTDPEAQLEIRRYATIVEELFAEHMPIVHKHFVAHGRIAP